MIQATDLRVGNWVDCRNFNGTGKTIRTQFDWTLWKYLHFLDPIELSPEILEKCGFEKYTEVPDDGIGDELEIWNNYCIDVFFDVHGALVLKDYHVNINRPKYLHQLQNLYFALTGEELTVNL